MALKEAKTTTTGRNLKEKACFFNAKKMNKNSLAP
jgi:hypothetical protein